MANLVKQAVLESLRQRYGELKRLEGSQSLFAIGDDAVRIYFRYSKVHTSGKTFFGLRWNDLRQLEGRRAFLCLSVDDGSPPVLIPYADFEDVFDTATPAGDGQFKVQLVSRTGSKEIYIARAGRFNVEGYVGTELLDRALAAENLQEARNLSHSQVQTLLAGIGHLKGYDVRVPDADVNRLEWSLTTKFLLTSRIPRIFDQVAPILSEIDVVWLGANKDSVEGLFEVEHSTPVYSGLLRFNDVLLTSPSLSRFHVVSNDARRSLFIRQARRPTFQRSGLSEVVSFLEYANVFDWHKRLTASIAGTAA